MDRSSNRGDRSRPVARRLDAHSLRGLAHPLRMQILDLLRMEGQSNSTRLAERVGESTGTVSWHLRQLAQHGFIEEIPGSGKRERWWRTAAENGVFDTGDLGDDPSVRRTVAEQLEEVLRWSFTRAARYLRSTLPGEWRNTGNLSSWTGLRLTPKQLAALTEELTQVVERHLPTAHDEPDPDALPVVVQFQVFPIAPEEES